MQDGPAETINLVTVQTGIWEAQLAGVPFSLRNDMQRCQSCGHVDNEELCPRQPTVYVMILKKLEII